MILMTVFRQFTFSVLALLLSSSISAPTQSIRSEGDDYSFINYAGHKKPGIKGMSSTINFLKDDLSFKAPVFLIQGEEDVLIPKEITNAYFDSMSAPAKEFFLIPGAAHGFIQSVVDMHYKILKERILPLTKK